MTALQVVVLAIVQGVTEFLPISSSGHLVLASWVLGWEDQGLAFDAAVHFGTGLAVVYYFRHQWIDIIRGFISTARPTDNDDSEQHISRKVAWLLVLGAIPAVVVGVLAKDTVEEYLRDPLSIGWFLIVTGTVLWLSEYLGSRQRGFERLNTRDAVVVGVSQISALLPGISRSGVTLATGLFRELNRETAARFSYLLGTPIILGAGVLQAWDLTRDGGWSSDWDVLFGGVIISAVVAFFTIRMFLALLHRVGLRPMIVYCLAAGAATVVAAYID